MEFNIETLEELMEEFKTEVEAFRKVEPKVDTTNLVESFDDDEKVAYTTLTELLDKLDTMIHGNWNTKVSVAINERVKKFASDCSARNNYLVSIETRQVKLELDEESENTIKALISLRKKIQAVEMFLLANDEKIPASFYKKDESGQPTGRLDVPNTPALPKGSDESDKEAVTRGRPSKERTLILGTVDEKGKTKWHEHDHYGKTFVDLFGTIRSDCNGPGLIAAVTKAGLENITKEGWNTPVEYAGYRWVAKVRK